VLEPQPDFGMPPEIAQRGVFPLQAPAHPGLVSSGVGCDEARPLREPVREVAVVAGRTLADRVGEAEVLARGDAGARQALAQIVAAAEVRARQDGFSPSSATTRRASSAWKTASAAKSAVLR
jgi:hypothetical protein